MPDQVICEPEWTHQEMNATIDCVAFAFPACGHSARLGMVHEDMCLITIHL